jgi:hypothetical protein
MTAVALPATNAAQRLAASLRVAPAVIVAFALGVSAGPFLSNALGWQITPGAALAQARAGLVELQSDYCDARARADMDEPHGQLGWRMRNELANKWARMPGNDKVEFDVVRACAQKLARR